MQFRFAAMESVTKDLIPKAASMVLVGRIATAFPRSEIVIFGKDLLNVEFAGSSILLAVLFVIGLLLLLGFNGTYLRLCIFNKG